MAADEPPYLTVGTDVSAKYKGAFCEAKVKKVNRLVKCKVTFKNSLGTSVVSDDQVRGTLRVGAHVEAKHPEKNQYLEAIINKLFDYSQYTVVFDDGDETTLRRTSLCLKSGRHFAESETLDQLPLTHPEHFGTPVMGSKSKRKRRSTVGSMSIDDDSTDEDSPVKKAKEVKMKECDPNLGKAVCVDLGDKRKKDCWFPALVVSPLAQDNIKINTKEDYLVRSFKDGKYYQIGKKDARQFTREIGLKVDSNTLKAAVEKAQTYLDRDELPPHWDRDLLMGLNAPSAEEDSHDSDSDTSDDEPSEEKDRFVAQLYKFMDERGTPINKAPTVGNRDLNLYKLFKIVQKTGGYNRVTNHNHWRTVYTKMGLPGSNPATFHQMRLAYKKYLHSFEDFYRKLGCTMVTTTRSSRVRHRSDRNFIMTRNRDRDLSIARGRQHAKDIEKRRFDERTKDEEREEEKLRTFRLQPSSKDEIENTDEAKQRIKEENRARTREEVKREKAESPDKREGKLAVKAEQESTLKEAEEKGKKERKEKDKEKKPLKDRKDEKLLKDDKEEKASKERKDDKPSKEKREDRTPRDRKDEKMTKEKRDDKMGKEKKEEKPIKEKQQRDKKEDKKEEKLCKEKREDKSLKERKDVKPIKDEKNHKDKREDKTAKDRVKRVEKGQKEILEEDKVSKDKKDSQVVYEKDRKEDKTTRLKIRKDDDDVVTLFKKQNKKKLMQSDDGAINDRSQTTDDEGDHEQEGKMEKDCISIGDRVKVKYGQGRQHKIYEAKVLKIKEENGDKRFYVHYTGWNMRYDEWIKKNRIMENMKDRRSALKKSAGPSRMLPCKTASIKRGRPASFTAKSSGPPLVAIRKSNPPPTSAPSTPTSVPAKGRLTRSDRNSLSTSPFAAGLEPRRRGRRKSGMFNTQNGISPESENESEIELSDKDMVEDCIADQMDTCEKFDENKSKADELDGEETEEENNSNAGSKDLSTEEEAIVPNSVDMSDETKKQDEETAIEMLPPHMGINECTLREGDNSNLCLGYNAKKLPNSRKASMADNEIDGSKTNLPSPPESKSSSVTKVMCLMLDDKNNSHDDEGSYKASHEKLGELQIIKRDLQEGESTTLSKMPETTAVAKFENSDSSILEKTSDGSKYLEDAVTEVFGEQLDSCMARGRSKGSKKRSQSCKIQDIDLLEESIEKLQDDMKCKDFEPDSVISVNIEVTNDSSEREISDIVSEIVKPCPSDEISYNDESWKLGEIKEEQTEVYSDATSQLASNLPVSELNPKVFPSFLETVGSTDIKMPELTEVITKVKIDEEIVDKGNFRKMLETEELDCMAVIPNADVDAVLRDSFSDTDANSSHDKEQNVPELGIYSGAANSNTLQETFTQINMEVKSFDSSSTSIEKPTLLREQSIKSESTTMPAVLEKNDERSILLLDCDKETSRKNYTSEELPEEPCSDEPNSIEVEQEESTKGKSIEKKKKCKVSRKMSLCMEREKFRWKDGKGKLKKKSKQFDKDDLEDTKENEGKAKFKKSKDKKNKIKRYTDRTDSDVDSEAARRSEEVDSETSEKIKKKKKKDEKKTNKTSENLELSKREKKKGKKKYLENSNFILEKRPKKKRKIKIPIEHLDSDEERGDRIKICSDIEKSGKISKKEKRKERRKSKGKDSPPTDSSSISPGKMDRNSFTKRFERKLKGNVAEQQKLSPQLDKAVGSEQNIDTDSDPDVSFLLCEEKVPASPTAEDHDTGSDDEMASPPSPMHFENVESPSSSQRAAAELMLSAVKIGTANHMSFSQSELSPDTGKHDNEISAVLDNTPPTTPESTTSALSTTPPHERDTSSLHDADSAHSSRDSLEGESDSAQEEMCKLDTLESEDSSSRTDSTLSTGSGMQDKTKSVKRQQSEEASPPKKRRKSSSKQSHITLETTKTGMTRQKTSSRNMKDAKDLFSASTSDQNLLCLAAAHSTALGSTTYTLASSSESDGTTTHLHVPTTSDSTQQLSSPTRPSKFNFYVPLDDYKDADKRIAIIQENLSELRKVYMALKAEVALIDRRRKKAKKKEKEAAATMATTSAAASSVTTAPALSVEVQCLS